MFRRIYLKRHDNLRLVIDGETEIGIHINCKGHPEVRWKNQFCYPDEYKFQKGFPKVAMPRWMVDGE